MKFLIIILLPFLLLSCDDNSNENEASVNSHMNDKSLTGKWRLVSREEINSGHVAHFPDTLDAYVFIEFTNDSLLLSGCDREIGWGTYSIYDGQLNIENFNYIEPCALKGWVESTTRSISYALTYSLMNDSLKIHPEDDGQYNLIFKSE